MNRHVEDLVSDCCGAIPRMWGETDTVELSLCSRCKDHCTYITESEYEDLQEVSILAPNYKKENNE